MNIDLIIGLLSGTAIGYGLALLVQAIKETIKIQDKEFQESQAVKQPASSAVK